MFWKILGAVILVWVAVVLLGVILKALFPLVALAVVGTGLYFLFRAISDGKAGDRDRKKTTV